MMVIVELEPEVTLDGLKVAIAPDGSPDAARDTVSGVPTLVVLIVVEPLVPAVRATLAAQIADLDSLINNLEKLPVEPARTEPVPTGVTYRERWEADTERRRLLLDSGIRLRAKLEGKGRGRNQGGQFTADLVVPWDIRARME